MAQLLNLLGKISWATSFECHGIDTSDLRQTALVWDYATFPWIEWGKVWNIGLIGLICKIKQVDTFILPLLIEAVSLSSWHRGVNVVGFCSRPCHSFSVQAEPHTSLCPSFPISEMHRYCVVWDVWAVPLGAKSWGSFRNPEESAPLWLSWKQAWLGPCVCQQKAGLRRVTLKLWLFYQWW